MPFMPDAGLEPILTRAQQRVFAAWSPASSRLGSSGFLSGLSAVQFNVFGPIQRLLSRTRALSFNVLLGSKLLSVRGLRL